MSKQQTGASTRPSRWQEFLLSFPVMPGNLSNVLIHNAFLKYYTDIIGLPSKYVGLIYAIFGIWNAINDPAIGIWLDRMKYRPRRGKYVYVMRLTAPVAIFSALAMLYAQPSWHEWVTFGFLLILLFVYDTAMTAFNIAHGNYKLIAAPASQTRVNLAVFTTYIANIGGFVGTFVATQLLVGDSGGILRSIIPASVLAGVSNKELTVIMFTAVIAINALLYFLALLPLKDPEKMYLKENTQTSESVGLFRSIAADMGLAFRSRSFVTYILAQFVGGGPRGFYFTPLLFMADHVLKLNGDQATILDIAMGIALFACVPFMGMYIKKVGMKRSTILFSFPCALGFLLITFVTNYWQALAAYMFMYIFSHGMNTAQGPLFGAIIDEDEQRTGTRKAGLFNGLGALLTIPVSGIQAAIFMGLISAFGYASGENVVQSSTALWGIRIGAGVLPCVFVLLGIIPLLFLPIDKAKEQELSDFAESRQLELDAASDAAEPEGAN